MDAAEKMLAWDDPRCALGLDALFTFAEEAERIQDVALAVAEASAGTSRPRTSCRGSCRPRSTARRWRTGRSPPSSPYSARPPTTRRATRWPTPSGSSRAPRPAGAAPGGLRRAGGQRRRGGAAALDTRPALPPYRHRDTQIRGVDIRCGDKVVMWYCSGDRDEEVFPDPGRFDIFRENARSHMAFGAGGAHFCIGAALGRQMIAAGLRGRSTPESPTSPWPASRRSRSTTSCTACRPCRYGGPRRVAYPRRRSRPRHDDHPARAVRHRRRSSRRDRWHRGSGRGPGGRRPGRPGPGRHPRRARGEGRRGPDRGSGPDRPRPLGGGPGQG